MVDDQALQMAGANCIAKNNKVTTYRKTKMIHKVVACSNKRQANSSIPFLPEAIIFNILVWLPADILYAVMKYVCREWYNMINDPDFINAHLLRSTAGLLLQSRRRPYSAHFAVMENWDGHTTKKLRFQFPAAVIVSCDGLVLFYNYRDRQIFYIANPVTKQQVALPPLPVPLIAWQRSALAYAHSTGEYKLVHSYVAADGSHQCGMVLTVGADNAWRLIDSKHISQRSARCLLLRCPLTIGAFIYWGRSDFPYFLAFDVEAEIIYQLPVPKGYEKRYGSYIKMGSFLSFVVLHHELLWEVWVLTDLKSGKWTKTFNLDLTSQRCIFEQVYLHYFPKCFISPLSCVSPRVWFRNGEVVFFRGLHPTKSCIVYNVKTGEIYSFETEGTQCGQINLAHVNSLVSLKIK